MKLPLEIDNFIANPQILPKTAVITHSRHYQRHIEFRPYYRFGSTVAAYLVISLVGLWVMRVFVSQLFHEASSFVPNKVTVEHFRSRHYLRGFGAVKDRFKDDVDWVSGALDPFLTNDDEITIGVCTACNPAGMIEYDSFIKILGDMVEEYARYVAQNGPPDVLMLLLHGANLVDGLADPDGYLIEQFQSVKGHGKSTVTGVTLDFHANISDKLIKLANIVVVGIEYPHVDTYERGQLASTLSRSVSSGERLETFRFPIPILTCLPNQATVENLPFKRLVDHVREIKNKHGITDLCISGGFAFGDCYDVGMNLIAINDKVEPCRQAFKEILEIVWEMKDELLVEIPRIHESWPRIEGKSKRGTVVVADVSDSPGSGGNADETHLLAALLKSKSKFVSAFHVDPSVVKQAQDIGTNNQGEFTFGTQLTHPESKILKVSALVSKLLTYEYRNVGPMMHGARLYAGPTVVLSVANGLIVVTTQRIQAYDINAFLALDIDITKNYPMIVAIKSTAHFRASYTTIADQGIELVRGHGWSDIDFKSFDYKFRRQPILPLDHIDHSRWREISDSYA